MNMILTTSAVLFPLITFPYVSRVLGVDSLGKVTFISSILAYFTLFAQLGIPTYGIRACSKVRDDKEKLSKTVQEILIINIITTLITAIVLVLATAFIDRLAYEKELVIILGVGLIFNLMGMSWLYVALEQYSYITKVSLLFKFLAVVMLFLLVKGDGDYIAYGFVITFASYASNILNFINLRKYVDLYKVRKNYNLKKHIKPIFVFFALTCATTIYTNLDVIILGFVDGDTAVGYYNVSVRIKVILLTIVTSLGAVLLPRLSFYVEKKEMDKFMELSNKSFQFILMLALSLAVYFTVYAKEVVSFIAGSGYNESVFPFQIILPTIILIGITNLFGLQILVPLDKERLVLYSVIVGAVVNFIMNMVLVNHLSFIGTAIANLLSELSVLLVQIYFIRDMIKGIIKENNLLYIIPALVLSAFVSLVSKNLVNGDFQVLAVSSIMFFITYYLVLRLFKNKLLIDIEKQVFKRFIRR